MKIIVQKRQMKGRCSKISVQRADLEAKEKQMYRTLKGPWIGEVTGDQSFLACGRKRPSPRLPASLPRRKATPSTVGRNHAGPTRVRQCRGTRQRSSGGDGRADADR